jgi:hypothetical protein
MDMLFDLSALMPGSKERTAGAATMLDIFKRVHHVWDEAKQPCQTACNASPYTATVSALGSDYDTR